RSFPPPLSRGVNSSGHPVCHRESGSAEQSRGLGLLPLPLAGEGWGGGERTRSVFLCAPSLSLQPKSDLSDFGQLIGGRTRVNPSSAASGGGDAGAARVLCEVSAPSLRRETTYLCPAMTGRG